MNKTVKTKGLNKLLFATKPDLLKKYIQDHRVELFKSLDIKDEQPVLLIFKSTSTLDHPDLLNDPLQDMELRTTVKVEYPATRHVIVNQMIHKNYKEHKSFWSKLKLLFSKKSIYTKDTKEV